MQTYLYNSQENYLIIIDLDYTDPASDHRFNKLYNFRRLHALRHRQLQADTNQSRLQESTDTKGDRATGS